jgi:hypothetical protein
MALSPQPMPVFLNCNGCVMGADPFRGVLVSPGTTDARGDAAVSVPIPASLPVPQFYNVYTQWFVLNPSGSCSLGFEMSNTLGLIIL